MARSRTPWMGSVTLTTAGTVYNLKTLILATANPPLTSGGTLRSVSAQLQNDPANGAAKVFIGNDDVSSTQKGATLLAGQFWPGTAMGGDSNIILADQIFLTTDTNSTVVNVTWLTR